jgi:DNA-binding MarR family transcriptional regulator
VGSTRLGRREKKVLKVLLKLAADRTEDRPFFNLKAGEILGAEVLDKLGIPFITLNISGIPYRKALNRLVKRELVELTSRKMRQVRKRTYKLTEKGREATENLIAEESRMEGLIEALRLLNAEGIMTLTMDGIHELLWQVSSYQFNNREEFENYWTKRRLGLALKKIGLKQVFFGSSEKRVRKYILTVNCTDNA